jgi:Zn ribbon nucleic-acid-binding protein
LDLSIQCPQCFTDQFIRSANPRRDELVTCVYCGKHYAYGELEDRAVASAKELLLKTFPGMRWE